MSLKPKRVDFKETWTTLQPTVQGVVTLGNVPRDIWTDCFNDIYSLCVAYPDPLADKLYQETKLFLDEHVKQLLETVRENSGENLLKCYYDAWNIYNEGVKFLHRLYSYLNQQHIKKQKLSEADIVFGSVAQDSQEQMEIGELGLDIWKKNMIDPLQENLVSLLLDGIQQDREGKASFQMAAIVQGVIESFVTVEEYKKKGCLELYETIFETPFLKNCGQYYKKEASRLLQECDVSQYMERVIQKLEEETVRSKKFLPSSSYAKVKSKFEQHMVADHLERLHGECHAMVAGERHHDLANMYPLLKPIEKGLPVLVECMLEHIRKQGLQTVTDLHGDNIHVQFVENMLTVHKKYKEVINSVFKGDQNFVGALDKACSSVINHRMNPKLPSRSPELLAKYCDSLLKKSSKGISEAEIDDKLAQSITIFKYIDDKDVFQKFYSRMLAKRLIHQQSQSMDSEEAMINRLKQACGYEFTNKLHRMFTDISVSTDLNSQFNEFLKKDNIELGINFSIYVLQAGAWPLGLVNTAPISVPQELEKSVQKFENFYHNRYNGRKLTWLHSLCQGELKLNYRKKPYMITMQTYQMAIVLLFEKTQTLSCSELEESLRLNSDQLSKHLASLLECKLLLCDTKTVTSESQISLNMEFSNKRTKFRITAALQRESPQETEQTLSSVDEDRKLYLQATIVRIMKARKVLRHNALINEVLGQSKPTFAPNVSMIKKCIESLIDKQYLERTPNSADEYSYVA